MTATGALHADDVDRDGAGSAADARGADARAEWTSALLWIGGAFVLRTLLSSFVPLLPDETYYWEWTRRLAGGYYDHPPGIAFLIRFGTLVFGDTRTGVRAGPAIAALVTHAAATAVAWNLAGRGRAGAIAARRAAAIVTLLPLATLGLVLATPDAPLFASAMVALLGVERALASPLRSSRSTMWWALAGLALGGAFLSKYTAVLLPFALVLACLVHPALRVRFTEIGPWLAGAIALLAFAPVVRWNAAHDWISFRFQLGHGFNAVSRGNPLTRELELIGGQLGLATPVLFVLLALAVWHALRTGWRARADVAPTDPLARGFALGVIAFVPLLFFAVSASRRTVEANWPALIYPGAMTLLAVSMAAWATGRAWRWGLGVAAVLLAIVSVQTWRPVLPLAPRKDPVARAHGWRRLALAVDSVRADPWLEGSGARWVAAERYQDASELAFHLHDRPTVFSLNISGRANQYDLWPTLRERARPGDALVAVFDANPQGDTVALRAAKWFGRYREGPTIALTRGTGEVAHRKLWLFRDLTSIPAREPAR